jgi:magnesium-transporting ATPase (P-type)
LTDEPWFTGLAAFGTWFIIMSMMVPISLIVTSELVKFAQSQFIRWDLDLCR